jgi:uncharacterized membrane protein
MSIEPILAFGVLKGIKQYVMAVKHHPILVNFTVALVPVSVAGDAAARLRRDESMRHAAWWTLLCSAAITPVTALTSGLFGCLTTIARQG